MGKVKKKDIFYAAPLAIFGLVFLFGLYKCVEWGVLQTIDELHASGVTNYEIIRGVCIAAGIIAFVIWFGCAVVYFETSAKKLPVGDDE